MTMVTLSGRLINTRKIVYIAPTHSKGALIYFNGNLAPLGVTESPEEIRDLLKEVYVFTKESIKKKETVFCGAV